MTNLPTAWIILGLVLLFWANAVRGPLELGKTLLVIAALLAAGINLFVAMGEARPYCDDPHRDSNKVCLPRPTQGE